MHESVLIEDHAGIAHVTLNRPEVGNAINLQMARELEACSRRLSTDPSVRAVVLSGAGRQFCVGGDIRIPVLDDAGIQAHVIKLTSTMHAAITWFVRMSAPLIAVASGNVAGAGVALVGAADLAIAACSAKFRLAYTEVGLTPDCGVSLLLPRLIGRKRALELLLTNRALSAEEALEWGLVNRVVKDEELRGAAEQLAGQLASGPLRAFGATKRLLAASQPGLEVQMALESQTIAAQRSHAEGREGAAAFFERRKPVFR